MRIQIQGAARLGEFAVTPQEGRELESMHVFIHRYLPSASHRLSGGDIAMSSIEVTLTVRSSHNLLGKTGIKQTKEQKYKNNKMNL